MEVGYNNGFISNKPITIGQIFERGSVGEDLGTDIAHLCPHDFNSLCNDHTEQLLLKSSAE